jgi:hypothetical protein
VFRLGPTGNIWRVVVAGSARVGALLASCLAVAACGSSPGHDVEAVTTAPGTSGVTKSGPIPGKPVVPRHAVELEPTGDSGLTGQARVGPSRDGEATRVSLRLVGAHGTTYRASMVSGSCGSLGRELFRLNNVTHGRSITRSAISYDDLILGSYAVVIFRRPPPDGVLACGDGIFEGR